MIYTVVGKKLNAILNTTEGWSVDRYRLMHAPTTTSWWIANGGFFFDGDALSGTPACLGLIERHLLWRKAKRMANRLVAEGLMGKVA